MKKIYQRLSLLLLIGLIQEQTFAQCATTATLGNATNMFTIIRNGNHPLVVDKTMNMVVFIHRNDAGTYGGNSGELRFDVSTNSGSTWTLNQGSMNPASPNYARYPNVAIYNPTNNVNPSNAYISYLAPTITSATSVWNGVVSGVRQVSGGVPTEIYNQNGIGTTQIPHSMVKGEPGVFWAIDPINTIATGFNIYKGVWSTTTNDVVWNINYSVNPPFTSGWTSAPQVVDYNIAFDPTGQIGYFSFLGHVTGNATNNAIYPVLYKTTNGGTTWTGPIQADLSGMSCITSNTTSGSFASCNVEHDLVVDANGNPHVITTVGSALNYAFNYSSWHHMYDITLRSGVWTAFDLGNVNGGPNTFGISPNFATQWQAPQAARSANGTKLFFTWTDNASYSLGTVNSLPDLYGKAYDVNTNTWTQTKNFTSCNTGINGRIWFPHLASEVLEPSASSWKMAGVFSQPSVTGDLGLLANFYFLDNLTFSSSEFTVAVPAATVTIAQAPTIIYCPSTTVNVNVTGAGDVIWINGVTTNPLPITTSSISTYSVIAQVGCLVGTASINVTSLTVNSGAVTSSICPGGAATFTAGGNALTYSWTPGTATGTNVSINPLANTVTLTATGSSGCAITRTVAINILTPPTISIVGTQTTCAGYLITQTANGAASYLWSDGITTGNTFTLLATTNTIIGVGGIGLNTCTNVATATVVVNPSPVVNATSSSTSVCLGQTVTLMGSGTALTYSWNGASTGPNLNLAPSTTTVYTLSGSNSFSCVTSKTVPISVLSLPTLTVTQNRASVCKNEKVTLTASGAQSYTWVTQGVLSSTVLITPTIAQSYSYQLMMLGANGCANTGTYVLIVNACTGIDEVQAAQAIQIWPNPNTGSFSLKSERSQDLQIINALGEQVRQFRIEAGQTEQISGLENGIYFVQELGGQTGKVTRIIVSH